MDPHPFHQQSLGEKRSMWDLQKAMSRMNNRNKPQTKKVDLRRVRTESCGLAST